MSVATLAGWQLVGYFGRRVVEPIPRVVNGILDDGARLVHTPFISPSRGLGGRPGLCGECSILSNNGGLDAALRSWRRNQVGNPYDESS